MAISVKDATGTVITLKSTNDGTDDAYNIIVDALPGTSETDIGAIKTAVEVLDNAISGTEMQVDVVASLPAGTNNIGDVDIASALPAGTNNIGDVDIASALPAGTNNIGDVDIASALPAGTNNIGAVGVASVAVPSTVVHGQTTVTTSGTEVALGSTTALVSGVTVKALSTNTGIVYVGGNPVTSGTGFELAAGEQHFVVIDDIASVYIDAAVDGEGVSFIGS